MAFRRSLRWSRCRHPCLFITSCTIALLGIGIFALWFGMNSDGDNVHPLLTQLIPAGHCACKTATIFKCTSCIESIAPANSSRKLSSAPSTDSPAWTFQYGRDDRNIALTRQQCQASFPGLFEDIDRAVRFWSPQGSMLNKAWGDIKLQNGMARAKINNRDLYIIETRAAQQDHRRKILATLSAIHRALIADSARTLNIEFVFSVEDKVEDVSGAGYPLWVYGRKATEESVWLIPDFGLWAWGNPASGIGPYDQVVKHIEMHDNDSWSSKIPKLIWRGKLSFAPKLRRALLEKARNKSWGDVKELIWSEKNHFISMEDHCKYMFIAHLEGRSFSSSLKYRQACRSVIIAHKLQYIQHHHYLLQSNGPHQNFVEVERDFTDLSVKIETLLTDPEQAKKIADNNVRIFRERYLTRAAEACYWRELWNGWDSVTRSVPKSDKEGLRYESFLLLDTSAMMSYSSST
ncbi:hypothetical protein AJ79_01032 [Helicocarpus griseus UAMH5409]|uniref:Glycosyl transferase CAP10 domain-containing protein n=1 Tax=Helicocarpus griseus UAMH5409 TaxID=1447875 RepID=A0A2B7Y8Y5_9EURO|nr:hypothetical protein AJ79_01032 [Helicocarpus griseus UAMH5409]